MLRTFKFSSTEIAYIKRFIESNKSNLLQLISDYYFEDDSLIERFVHFIDKILLKLEGVSWSYGEEYTSSN